MTDTELKYLKETKTPVINGMEALIRPKKFLPEITNSASAGAKVKTKLQSNSQARCWLKTENNIIFNNIIKTTTLSHGFFVHF
ncbi:hypothetical protein MQX03_13135 [Chryseobacterium aahli]|nr:hypothetical protein [Chryseobacterium aahli]MCI3938150.1 hypothetical protein [Chryseobacterium aahli]